MAAISTCSSEPRKRAWQKGGVHVCRYFVRESMGETAGNIGNLLNTMAVLFPAETPFRGVLKGHVAAKGA